MTVFIKLFQTLTIVFIVSVRKLKVLYRFIEYDFLKDIFWQGMFTSFSSPKFVRVKMAMMVTEFIVLKC